MMVVPVSAQDWPAGTYRSVGTVTAPPVPMQHVIRSALAPGGAASTETAVTAALMVASVATVRLGIAVLPARKEVRCSAADVRTRGCPYDGSLLPRGEGAAGHQMVRDRLD